MHALRSIFFVVLVPLLCAIRLYANPFAQFTEMSDVAVRAGPVLVDVLDGDKSMGSFAEIRFGRISVFDLKWQLGLYARKLSDIYGDVGLVKEWSWRSWLVSVSSSVGVLKTRGENVLGCPIEFLSYLEVGRVLPKGYFCGAAFGHISNAHLANRNPGTEFLRFSLGKRW